jgi:membrane protease YdiL (CAAX protease family)
MNKATLFAASWVLSIFLLVVLSLSYQLAHLWPSSNSVLALIFICLHIGIPLYILERFKINARYFNLYAYDLESIFDKLLTLAYPSYPDTTKIDYVGIKHELKSSLPLLIAILVPYTSAYYILFSYKAWESGQSVAYTLTFPSLWVYELFTQIFTIALPEEFFYRGFLQSSLLQKWTPTQAIITTNIIFAFGHFVGNFDLPRLLTFFPGLIFSLCVYRYRSLLSAILFHAIFNIFGQILFLSIKII